MDRRGQIALSHRPFFPHRNADGSARKSKNHRRIEREKAETPQRERRKETGEGY